MVPENLLEKNLGELRALAQAKGVKNIGKYRKSELIEMLSGQSEPPAPKKRGRPTKAAKAVPLKAETPAEGEPQPASAPAAKAPSQKAKKAPARGKKPQPKGKTAPGAEQPPAQEPPKAEPAPLPEAPKAEEPASQEPAKAENREGTAEKGEPRRRNDRPQNTRYQKGYTRHFGNYNNGERRYQGQNGQEQKTYRPAASAEHSAAAGEEEKPYYNQEYGTANPAVPRMLETENCPPTEGVLEVLPDGYGFLRMDNYYSGPKDIYLSITQIRRFSLKTGDYVEGRARPHREGDKFDALMYIDRVNGLVPDENARRKSFEELVPIFPDERYTLETEGEGNSLSARLIDLIAPIGKGQRAMIVSQPKAGKT
ncbi:MAG: Rho termination factor N-terminal domain-containing protein, partial [Clostridia bacterium]|nr:Rho termination factor N-terminal domain-containing protein [Clostridia bacterium]